MNGVVLQMVTEGECRRNVRIWEELEDQEGEQCALLSLGEPDALLLWLVWAAMSRNEPNMG